MRSPIANTITLRGTPVDFRVVGVFNQVRSPEPGTKGLIDRKAIVQYPGTSTPTIAARGGYHIWPKGNDTKAADGYDVEATVDAAGALHLKLPSGFQPPIRYAMPRDNVAATCTHAEPLTPAVADREFALN